MFYKLCIALFSVTSLCTRMQKFSDLELIDLCKPWGEKARKQLGIKTKMGFSSGRVTLFYTDEKDCLNSSTKDFKLLASGAGRDCYSVGDVPVCLKVCEVNPNYQGNQTELAISKDQRLDGLITKVLCFKEYRNYTVILVERAGATASQFLQQTLNGMSSGSSERWQSSRVCRQVGSQPALVVALQL